MACSNTEADTDAPSGNAGAGGTAASAGFSAAGSSGVGGSGGGSSGGGGSGGTTWPGGGGVGAESGIGPAVDVAASPNPPGGLSAEQVPMFVVFGFDDNGYADGIDWFLDLVRSMSNPDGSLARVTFFNTAIYGDSAGAALGKDPAAVKAAWLRAAADGHEIGNHTWSHQHGASFTADQWRTEIGDAGKYFMEQLGLPANKLLGFRTPYLEFGTGTFEVLTEKGIGYDCSIEFGYDWFEDASGGHSTTDVKTGGFYPWPFTLDEGNMGKYAAGYYSKSIAPIPGMWEVPVYTFNVPVRNASGEAESVSSRITGFDFNLFKKAGQDASVDPLDTLIFSFEQRRTGNRSPFSIGAHTDYYSSQYVDAQNEFGSSTYQDRRKVIEDFIAHVRQYPEVRIVPMVRVLAWMTDPKPL